MGKNIYTLALLLAVIAIFLLFFVVFCKDFLQRRNYIVMEINRSFGKRERNHWKRELKRLYVSQIPFIGSYFASKIKG